MNASVPIVTSLNAAILRLSVISMVATGLMVAGTALADMPIAGKKAKCAACHAINKKVVGPAFMAVAAKYKGDKDAVSKMVANITRGGQFGYNLGIMPPKGIGATDSEIRTMAEFIAGLTNDGSVGQGQPSSTLLNVLGAVATAYVEHESGKNSSAQNQTTADYTPEPARRRQQQQSASQTGSSSQSNQVPKHVHNPANEAMNCISLFRDQGHGSVQMKNICGYSVSVLWPGGIVDIRPGGSYPSFEQGNFEYFACRYGGPTGAGLHQSPEQKALHRVSCADD